MHIGKVLMYQTIKPSFFKIALYILLSSTVLSCGFNTDKPTSITAIAATNSIANVTSIANTNTIADIQEKGKLRVAISYSPTGFFMYKGTPMGFHYDMAERLSKNLGVSLDLVITKNESEQLQLLKERKVDLIVESIVNQPSIGNFIDFIVPLKTAHLVLVQRKANRWPKEKPAIQKIEDLVNKNIHLAQINAHISCIKSISAQLNNEIFIWDVDEKITQYQLVEEVSQQTIDYAIVDENVGKLMQSRYQNIDLSLRLSPKEKFSWVSHKEAIDLTQYIDDWVVNQQNNRKMASLYKKYYKNHYAFNKRAESEYLSHETGKISKFDDLIKKHAKQNQIDWRLLAALIQQESRFNPTAVSWAGAKGLMQLMPATAQQYGYKNLTDPELNIKAGIQHFNWLKKYWKKKITDKEQRLKFVLASYNVGQGHVSDAMKLAKKYGKSPVIWDNNVDIYIQKKSDPDYYKDPVVKYGYCRGKEPFDYVNKITKRYKRFKQILVLEDEIAVNEIENNSSL